jgi:hypothetical protein
MSGQPNAFAGTARAASSEPVVRVGPNGGAIRATPEVQAPPFDAQQFASDDATYQGSRFAQLREALFANRYQKIWGAPGEPPLPVYDVRFSYLVRGALRGATNHLFRQASARAVDSRADLRWGEDQRGFRRIVHPNGVALFGRWEITAPTEYSGYFASGASGLIVGRYSVCCSEPRRGRTRSLSLAGKLFPTTDPAHADSLQTANFLTQQDIGGEVSEYINDVELRNAPDTTGLRRGLGLPTLFITGVVFAMVDQRPSIRQLYPIAELGKPPAVPTRAPEYMRLLMARDQPRTAGEDLDFRDEVLAQIYDRGDAVAKRKLCFDIEVTDEGEESGPLAAQHPTFRNWRRIGKITFTEAVASYNTDFVLHFNHPSWRADRNDPTSATRLNARKVRGGPWWKEIVLGAKAT